jgi:flagellar assembly protein FliH
MSSSKVYKKDPHFTPTPLVQRNIAPVNREQKPSTDAPGSPLFPEEMLRTAVEDQDGASLSPVEAAQDQETSIDVEMVKLEAYNQGKADLAAELQMAFQQAISAFTEGCRKIDIQRKKMLNQSRGDLINLIILLSEKILGQELATPRNIIAATLQSALEQAIECEEYYVTVHPEDLAFAETKAPEVIAAIRGLERIVFKTDESMTRGGCLLESSVSTVDATIETQLAAMKEFLTEQPLFLPFPEFDESEPQAPPANEAPPEA